MKKSTKRIIFYVVYIAFVFIASTSAILARSNSIYGPKSGYNYKIASDGDVSYEKSHCPCYSYERDSQGRCKNCGKYVIPEKFAVDWKKARNVVKRVVRKVRAGK